VATIVVGGLKHETNTFSTVPTRYEDMDFRRGEELVQGAAWDALRTRGHRFVPLFVAHATPSGRVTRAAFDRLLGELLDGIRAAMPVDGVLLVLHGAMEVEEIGDGETAIVAAVRSLVGKRVMIAASLDLHANLAPAAAREVELFSAYRTAPHRDEAATAERAAALLVDALERGTKPRSFLLRLPLLVGGEAAVTEVEPARSLFARLPEVDRVPGILCSSILVGCAWTDTPFATMSVLVSGTDDAVMRREAAGIASEIWRRRAEFRIDSPTAEPEAAIRRAAASPIRPVFISDSGDNPTAGAAGDSPYVLELLVRGGAQGALVAGIADPAAVDRCFSAGVGAAVNVSLGGKLDATFASPYACTARVLRLVTAEARPRRALVEVGGVHAVLQTDRRPFTELRDFASAGIAPGSYQMIVVKLGYLFPELRDYAPRHVMALTPGFGDQRLERLPYRALRRPVYPLDLDTTWEPDEEAV
jgi:microcystin degradation protein MlrC